MARMKKRVIRSGGMLEVNYYPVTVTGEKIPNEQPKHKPRSKKQIEEANRRQAVKKFVRIINTNFGSEDYFITLTYNEDFAPLTLEQAEKDITNFFNRVKYHIKKNGGNPKKFKYAYTPQVVTYKTGIYAGLQNYHFHIFMSNAGMSAEEIKSLWKFGTKGSIEHYDPYRFGPEAAAKYMSRNFVGKKMYRCSRNMDKPIIEEEKNACISASKVEELGRNRCDDAHYWEKKYPSYSFMRMDKVYNEINGCWYLNVVMYKKPTKNNSSYYEKSRRASLEYAHINKK